MWCVLSPISVLKIAKNKFLATWQILKSPGYLKPIQISEMEAARAKISSVLQTELRIQGCRQEQALLEITDKITAKLYESDFASLSLLKNQDDLFRIPMWEYSLICSLSALWEWRVKLLAERLDISTGRKQLQSNGEVLAFRFRNMELIINDINSQTRNRLNLRLHDLRGIRNSLLHGSFH